MGWRRVLAAFAVIAGSFPAVGAAAAGHAHAPSPRLTYATMPDGTRIAVVVSFPSGFSSRRHWPALFMMDGYDGGGGALDPAEWADRFVMVHASVRGTGCSGGSFDLFSHLTAMDGKDIVDRWIPSQSWSNGRVGIIGHSYPGLTGFAVGETAPRHLDAMAVSGLIDDLYSGLSYPGGVPNGGFTLLWTGVERPESELTGNLDRYATSSDQHECAHNIAARPAPDVADDPVLNGLTTTDEGQWWVSHSLVTNVADVRAPTMITQQYQDEQTGPQGGFVLWRDLSPSVPKQLILTNGAHDTNVISHADELAWVTCWVIDAGNGCGAITAAAQRVRMHFETTGPGNVPFQDHVNPALMTRDYPASGTRWTEESLPSGRYVTEPEGRQFYLTGPGMADAFGSTEGPETLVDDLYSHVYGPPTTGPGPDELNDVFRFPHEITLAGPIPVSLWLRTSAPDTDVFVQLIDEAPNGDYQYLQRGLLRASYRAVDRHTSYRITTGPKRGQIYWWQHPFTNRQLLTPNALYHLHFDIPPIGAVLRPGHKLLVQIYSPPLLDQFDAYGSAQAPAVNTVVSDTAHRSSLLLPILPQRPHVAEQAPSCGTVVGERCVHPG